jgi:hypothetical protein
MMLHTHTAVEFIILSLNMFEINRRYIWVEFVQNLMIFV